MPKLPNPSKWETHVADRLETIRAWKRQGLTDKEIAANLGISRKALIDYKKLHSDLRDALKTGKSDADAQVVNALFRSACGYEYEEVETTVTKSKDGSEPIPRIRKIKKHVLPNVTAQIFYLCNRIGKDWRSVMRQEITGADGGPVVTGKVVLYLPDNGRMRKKQEQQEQQDAGAEPRTE
ncbi:MAG TPA: transposase [Myxococcota bacterium]|mgnify:CR=1 FL=1|nr:transposase [Myxococcota bacterium]